MDADTDRTLRFPITVDACADCGQTFTYLRRGRPWGRPRLRCLDCQPPGPDDTATPLPPAKPTLTPTANAEKATIADGLNAATDTRAAVAAAIDSGQLADTDQGLAAVALAGAAALDAAITARQLTAVAALIKQTADVLVRLGLAPNLGRDAVADASWDPALFAVATPGDAADALARPRWK